MKVRRSIPGVMLQRDQDVLFIIVQNDPTWHYDEYADKVFEETDHQSNPTSHVPFIVLL